MEISSKLYQEGAPEFVHVGSMEEAVAEAKKRAKPGDIVTLSPACASLCPAHSLHIPKGR